MTTSLELVFEGLSLRFVGTPEMPEWVAQDVCTILGIKNVSDAIADFDDSEKGLRIVSNDTKQVTRKMATVYEAGLYRLIFQSRKPEAQRFAKWVWGEVLPSIRKFGTYPPPADMATPMQIDPAAIRMMVRDAIAQELANRPVPQLAHTHPRFTVDDRVRY